MAERKKKLTPEQALKAEKYLRRLDKENNARKEEERMSRKQMFAKAASAAKAGRLNEHGVYIRA